MPDFIVPLGPLKVLLCIPNEFGKAAQKGRHTECDIVRYKNPAAWPAVVSSDFTKSREFPWLLAFQSRH
jgi:hypothetical protein